SEMCIRDSVETAETCSIEVSPTKQTFSAEQGNGSFSILTDENCEWSASSDSEWITVTSTTIGKGSSTMSFSVSQNTGERRTGHINVNEAVFEVVQEGLSVSVVSITKMKDPFRLAITVSAPFFNEQSKVYIQRPNEPIIEWTNFKVKSPTTIILKGGKNLKQAIKAPTGMVLKATLNPDRSLTISFEQGHKN
ncbi:MAG: BACON domain-containing protein, partial [Acidobacteria bacterium]|nr:BACON domain-containing protein [Acidobacteriota bacterium]